ncbi:MFS transporter [Xanthomonas fragariae]|uniref:MFS transporter n=1 Tax=Xanthomonas fragariae TaxID=48664 RepID=A0A1Y6GSI4_9XANT|nr:MFS transporter [Xanthomonas fragariae]SMQ98154.1 hypothetical protein PD885_00895 [Xanthomonas fragariae]SMR04382.1 MFS transporter [Xanthomonas fragariae]
MALAASPPHLVHGPLSDAWGRRRVMRGGLALFIAGSVGYTRSVAQIALPWAVLPIFLACVGMALIFPIQVLAVLDMYLQ